jgi:diguanylate cyclase (GGDEF)-like protein
MLTKIKQKLIAGFDIEKSPFLYRRLIMTSALLFIALFAFTTFIFINVSNQKYILACFDSLIAGVTLISLYFLFFRKNIEFSSHFCTVMLFLFLIFFSYSTQNHSFGLIWTICFPLFVIPILGARRGMLMISLYYLLLIPMAYQGIGEWDNGYWNNISFLRFTIASITVVYTAYFFEKSSVAAYEKLLESRENEKNYLKKLESLSVTDQLTGLFNRRYFDDHFQLECKKALRYASKLCVVMIDIDHFKAVNDRFGHQVGDLVLKEFSNLLKNRTRTTDILSRWGGEEFIILLPATSVSNGGIIAEKMRAAVAETMFEKIGHMTASFGVSEVKLNETLDQESILNADKALYQSKTNGRNQVTIYEKD